MALLHRALSLGLVQVSLDMARRTALMPRRKLILLPDSSVLGDRNL